MIKLQGEDVSIFECQSLSVAVYEFNTDDSWKRAIFSKLWSSLKEFCPRFQGSKVLRFRV